MYTISLCTYVDSRMIGPPRTLALGHKFLNKKLIRSSRRMDAVAAKSDAPGNVRSRTLTDAYGRWFPVRGFCSFRVWPCQSVPQCDWAFSLIIFCAIILFFIVLFIKSKNIDSMLHNCNNYFERSATSKLLYYLQNISPWVLNRSTWNLSRWGRLLYLHETFTRCVPQAKEKSIIFVEWSELLSLTWAFYLYSL